MQRRWAAIYAAFFVVTAAGAYSVVAFADQPDIQIEGPTYGNNSNFTVGGQEYQVTDLGVEEGGGEGGGGHGGDEGGGPSFTGTLVWTNDSAQFEAELENNTTVDFREGEYRVLVPNESDPTQFSLNQEFNVSQRLQNDPAVYNETVTVEDEERVVYRENGSTRPLDQYLPEPQNETFSEGDQLQFQGNQTTVDNVSTDTVRLVWTGSKTNEETLEEGQNITLADDELYVVHFVNEEEVQISPNVAEYQDELRKQDTFHERMNGFWMVVYISSLAAILIVGLAYLPVRG